MERPKPSRDRTEEETLALEHALDTFVIGAGVELPDELIHDLERHAEPVLALMAERMPNAGDFVRLFRHQGEGMNHAMMYLCIREIARRRAQEKAGARGAPFLWWHSDRQAGAMCVGGTRVTVEAIQTIDAQGLPGDAAKAFPQLTEQQIELALTYRQNEATHYENVAQEATHKLIEAEKQWRDAERKLEDSLACDGHDCDYPTCECFGE